MFFSAARTPSPAAATVRNTDAVCVARNSYTSHPENLLHSILTEDEPEVREDAFKTVVSIREGGDGVGKAPRPLLPLDD